MPTVSMHGLPLVPEEEDTTTRRALAKCGKSSALQLVPKQKGTSTRSALAKGRESSILRSSSGLPFVPDDLEQQMRSPKRCRTSSVATFDHVFAEVFSPPRMAPVFVERGFLAVHSFDILQGCDLLDPEQRRRVVDIIGLCRPRHLMISPPCTVFSQMQRSNVSRRKDTNKWCRRYAEGVELFNFALELAEIQQTGGRFFTIEHPSGASSWKLPQCEKFFHMSDVKFAVFHQCVFGAKTKFFKMPTLKPTALLTNSPSVYAAFHEKFCRGRHSFHARVHGSEGGMTRTAHAAIYPRKFCSALATCMLEP